MARIENWNAELRTWLSPFLEKLGHKARRQMCPLYVSGLIVPGDRKSVQPMAERLAPGDYDQLHHFIAAGLWDAAPLEAELLIQADRLVGGSLFVVVPCVVFGVAASGPLLRVLLGHEFSAAATPYALLLVTAGLLFPIIFLAEALNAAGYQRLNLLLLVGLTPPMAALVLVLAPRAGAAGVAIALLAGYASYLAALLGAACFRLGSAAPVSALGASMLAAAAGALAVALSSGAGSIAPGMVGAAAAAIAFAGVRPDIAGAIVRLVDVRQRLTVHPVVQEAPYGQRTS